jgi:hypothetical protein
MIAEVRKYAAQTPFVPFSIRMVDGHEYPIPTADHIYLPPRSTRVVVTDDKGVVAVLPSLFINAIIHQAAGTE